MDAGTERDDIDNASIAATASCYSETFPIVGFGANSRAGSPTESDASTVVASVSAVVMPLTKKQVLRNSILEARKSVLQAKRALTTLESEELSKKVRGRAENVHKKHGDAIWYLDLAKDALTEFSSDSE